MAAVVPLNRRAAAAAPAALPPAGDRVLRLPELVQRSGLSRATLYRRIASGRFPPLMDLGGQARGLRESQFLTWLANLESGASA